MRGEWTSNSSVEIKVSASWEPRSGMEDYHMLKHPPASDCPHKKARRAQVRAHRAAMLSLCTLEVPAPAGLP